MDELETTGVRGYPGSAVEDLRGKTLIAVARDALRAAFGAEPGPQPEAPWLRAPGATFVTLRKSGRLRGCVGTLEPCRSLIDDVRVNARASAFSDPRFEPLRREELDETTIEVTELSPTELLPVRGEREAMDAIRPGVDGVLIAAGGRRGTFLPQMWDQLPTKQEFFHHLKLKAGIDPHTWPDDMRVWRYQAKKHKEREEPELD
jgi:hypothetical protein